MMPKDEWAAARAKDIGRRALQEGRAERQSKSGKRKKTKTKQKLGRARCLFFGKFKEVPFESVPTWYLTWVLREIKTLKDAVRRRIQQVLDQRRRGGAVYAPAETRLDKEYRAVAGAAPVQSAADPGGAPF